MRRILYSTAFILICAETFSQGLSLKTVSDSVLMKNLNVRIARLEQQIAQEQNNAGRAGALPSLSVFAVEQGAVVATRQEFFNGDVRQADDAVNNNTTVSARLDWTLFQGFAVQGRREELRALAEMGEVAALQKIEDQLYNAASVYYEILWREELIGTLRVATSLSRQRNTLAQQRMTIGSGNRLDVLQSSSDLNSDSSSLLREINAVVNLKTRLAILMGNAPDMAFSLADSLFPSRDYIYATVYDQALNQNRQLMLRKAEIGRAISLEKINRSQYYPGINFFGEYNFVQSQNQVGILKSNRSLGPAFGLSLQYNLFNGFNTRTDVRVAKLGRELSELSLEQARLDLQASLMQVYNDYVLQQNLVTLEKASLKEAEENLKIADAQLQYGAITDLQFREVQGQYVQAGYRLINARHLAKVSELSLQYLSGGLIPFLVGQ